MKEEIENLKNKIVEAQDTITDYRKQLDELAEQIEGYQNQLDEIEIQIEERDADLPEKVHEAIRQLTSFGDPWTIAPTTWRNDLEMALRLEGVTS